MSEYTRRHFLLTLAAAPAAACVARADVKPATAKPVATPAATPAPAAGPDPLDKIRAFRMPDGTEPAFVFRALPGAKRK